MGNEEENAYKVRVEDGNSKFREIFKPDYAKTRDLEKGKIKLTNWHWHVINKVENQLEHNGNYQNGINFIKRRFVINGLKWIDIDNERPIREMDETFARSLKSYDRRETQKLRRTSIIGDSDGSKEMLYMDEDSFGRVRKLGKILHLTNDSVERVAFAYTITELKDFFDEEVVEEAGKDIREFKEHIKNHVTL